jgi:ketosteroid isomerase-like protein
VPRTSEETFRRLLELLLAKEMDAVADLWAEDGTAEFPFAVGASPRRLSGREAVREYLAGYPDLMDVQEIPSVTVHHLVGSRPDRPDRPDRPNRPDGPRPDRPDAAATPHADADANADADADPAADTVVVEFTARGRTVATGAPYRLDYVTVVTTRNGLITHYRDYWNPLAVASAAGTLPALLGSLRGEDRR